MQLKDIHEGLAKRTYAKRRITPVARIYKYLIGEEQDLDWQSAATVGARLKRALEELAFGDPEEVTITHLNAGADDLHGLYIRVPESITQRNIEQIIEDVVESTKKDYKDYEKQGGT